MPFKRPHVNRRASSDTLSDDSDHSPPFKRQRAGSTVSWDGQSNQPLKVYVIQAKLDADVVKELYDLLEREQNPSSSRSENLDVELCSDVADADVVITVIHMRKRLERHIDWKLAKQKAIVTPDWLRNSVKQGRPLPCGEYAAVSELHGETVEHCPERDCEQCGEKQDPASGYLDPPGSQSGKPVSTSSAPSWSAILEHTSPKVRRNWSASYACTRASPLLCPNPDLAAELAILYRSRELEGKQINSLSYERAIAVIIYLPRLRDNAHLYPQMIKSYPRVIDQDSFEEDVVKLPHLGKKILSKIEEFIDRGYIEESRTIAASTRFQSLSLFSTIYGIGPVNARKLYDMGLRTIEDMERYYDVPVGTDNSHLDILETEITTPNGHKITTENKLPDLPIKVALALRKDLEIKIPRQEVDGIHAVVMNELEKLQPGCISMVVGGYRRGKQESNDVDIVIGHRDLKSGAGLIKGLCTRFTKHLHDQGLVTHVMHLSGFHKHNSLRTEHWDSLEKALTIFVLPPEQGRKKLHRRVDLIFAAPEAYWTAVIGWTGSKMFERDLRLWAKVEKGMKFDSSGLTRRHDSKLFIPRSEKEVFDILGLEWIDPTLRNADV